MNAPANVKDAKKTVAKIVWVTSEKNKVAREVFRLTTETPNISTLQAINTAIKNVLEPARQRHIKAVSVLPWLAADLARLKIEAQDREAERIAAEKEALLNKPVDLTTVPMPEILSEMLRRFAVHFSPMAEVILKEVLTNNSTAISATVRESVAEAFSNLKFYPEKRVAKSPTKEHLKSVVVVGLLPAQISKIRSAGFDEVFNLHFWKDQSPKVLRQLSASCDYVVAMTKFISHAHEEIIKNNCKQGSYIRLHGGVEALEDKLTGLL